MTTPAFQRARSAEAKQAREEAILEAARALGRLHGVREVSLTDIAAAVGMHKSALLRYFETREQIFLRLTAEGWREWSADLRADLARRDRAAPAEVAEVVAATLAARPMFCDLLAQAPLNLERNVSMESVRAFKLVTLAEIQLIDGELRRLLGLTELQTVDLVATATSMAGALLQMATPGPRLRELYESDPRLGHALVEVEPRLRRVLAAFLAGLDEQPAQESAGEPAEGSAAGRP
ncbi:TetR/AcrR family transcriptional regulator [Streptomyces cadmiisoli]|uniref:TetR/AcrR family transcriptional regulator n=1 Tax=Streptomyces cadmiisoli TaxID=2184053 RepID=A0A2Z4J8C3_9ACTN|nr:TetR family transcriptional regulator [Streptomyces cadmiisoli]AWW41391.1 TetR/AcrR family transcriptional regulator [Streptomyces cadmiisoli]